jgi:hypothetical protein
VEGIFSCRSVALEAYATRSGIGSSKRQIKKEKWCMPVRVRVIVAIVGFLLVPSSFLAQSKIRVGQTIRESLSATDARMEEDGTLYDLYVLNGQRGQRITIELSSQSFDPYLTLLEDDGTEILSASAGDNRDGRRARLQTTLPYAGEYLIRVNGLHKKESGRYTLIVKSP